ncbi:MAG: carcinine hydrolase/isopenicillin-N N-acyltransferase family protein [bacterium]
MRSLLLALGNICLPLYACTIGAFSPLATQENRPILWKNRDVHNPDQEMRFFSGPRYSFIANVYAGETLNVWAGINEAGFAIMNSNSYNLSGDGGQSDDGNIMRQALGNCGSVEDFARLLDSLNIIGRETPANYGVFDSTSTTAIFEASYTSYTRYDANLDSLGFLLRANFSMSGGPSRLLGKNRYERAMQLCSLELQKGKIAINFIIQSLCRDLGQVDFDPYPLPYLGWVEPLPYGYLPTDTTICRYLTRSALIMVGPKPGSTPKTAMMWVLLGEPVATLPVPLWVQGGAVPGELDGHLTAAICDEAQKIAAWLYPDPQFPRAINTFRLTTWLDYIVPVESTIQTLVARTETIYREAGPDPETAARLTRQTCALIIDTYKQFYETIQPEPPLLYHEATPNTIPTIQNSSHKLPNTLIIFDPTGRKVTTPVSSGLFFVLDRTKRIRIVLLNRCQKGSPERGTEYR